MDDSDEKGAERAGLTPEQRAMRRLVARALWAVDSGKTVGADKADAKAAFAEVRATYQAKAGKLVRMIERRGVTFTLPVAEEAAAEED